MLRSWPGAVPVAVPRGNEALAGSCKHLGRDDMQQSLFLHSQGPHQRDTIWMVSSFFLRLMHSAEQRFHHAVQRHQVRLHSAEMMGHGALHSNTM